MRKKFLLAAFLLFLAVNSGCSSISRYQILQQTSERIGTVEAKLLETISDPSATPETRELLNTLLNTVSDQRKYLLQEMQVEEERRRNWFTATLLTFGTILTSGGLLAALIAL